MPVYSSKFTKSNVNKNIVTLNETINNSNILKSTKTTPKINATVFAVKRDQLFIKYHR